MDESRVKKVTLNAKEAANYLGISYWLLTQLAKRSEVPHFRLGRRLLFTMEALEKYIKEKQDNSILESIKQPPR